MSLSFFYKCPKDFGRLLEHHYQRGMNTFMAGKNENLQWVKSPVFSGCKDLE